MQQPAQSDDVSIESFFEFLRSARPYFLRLGRAVAHSLAIYMMLWLQPHYNFSFFAMAVAVFFLSLPKRTLPIAEVILLIVAVSIFIPVGFTQTLINALS
jgi:hypothetical protein